MRLVEYCSPDLPELDDLSLEAVQPFKCIEVLKVESCFGLVPLRVDVPKLPQLTSEDAFLSLKIANVNSRGCG